MHPTSSFPALWPNLRRVCWGNCWVAVGALPCSPVSLWLRLISRIDLDASFGKFLWRVPRRCGSLRTH
jgi:hypothetical protein